MNSESNSKYSRNNSKYSASSSPSDSSVQSPPPAGDMDDDGGGEISDFMNTNSLNMSASLNGANAHHATSSSIPVEPFEHIELSIDRSSHLFFSGVSQSNLTNASAIYEFSKFISESITQGMTSQKQHVLYNVYCVLYTVSLLQFVRIYFSCTSEVYVMYI